MKQVKSILGIFSFSALLLLSCKNEVKQNNEILAMESGAVVEKTKKPKRQLSQEFKDYWYAGKAEISSYELIQARYGEFRKGSAVLIYVTEPFLAKKQVKADGHNPDNVQVLKLNSTKKYLTGIYPYSIMNSSFYPVYDNQHAVKVSFSSQEWCGHVYAQINNKDDFEVTSHSYFETEADENFNLEKHLLENEIWNKIRINPNDLPIGKIKMIPSLEYVRLSHKKLKAYEAEVSLNNKENTSIYSITYPELQREINITFSSKFPYEINSWTETFSSGFGVNAKVMTTTAKKINTIKSPYWQENKNSSLHLRDSLGL